MTHTNEQTLADLSGNIMCSAFIYLTANTVHSHTHFRYTVYDEHKKYAREHDTVRRIGNRRLTQVTSKWKIWLQQGANIKSIQPFPSAGFDSIVFFFSGIEFRIVSSFDRSYWTKVSEGTPGNTLTFVNILGAFPRFVFANTCSSFNQTFHAKEPI